MHTMEASASHKEEIPSIFLRRSRRLGSRRMSGMARLFFSPDSSPDSHHTIPPMGKVRKRRVLRQGSAPPDGCPLGVSWG